MLQWCCPSVDFSYLHIRSWSSTIVTVKLFVTTLTKAILHQLLSLASYKKNPGCIKLLPLRVTETTYFCDLSKYFFFLNPSPDVWLDTNLFLISTDSSFDPRAWFLLRYALSAVGSFIKMCVPFQIIPIQLNLPQLTFTQSLVTPTSNMNAPELNSICPR